MKYKTCTKCGEEKAATLEFFYKSKRGKHGTRGDCKACKAKYCAHRNALPEVKAKKAKYYADNREEIRIQQSQAYADNREEICTRRRWHYSTRPGFRAKRAEYATRPGVKAKRAEYVARPEVKIWKAKYEAQRVAKKEATQPGCVYELVNDVNNKVYIGQTTRGLIRWEEHIRCLRGNYHENPQLQKDFNEHGEKAFGLKFRIIQEYPKDKEVLLLHEALEIEQHIQEGIELYNEILSIDQLKMLTEHRRTNEYI